MKNTTYFTFTQIIKPEKDNDLAINLIRNKKLSNFIR